ncbi:alpha/beta hydrolase [Jiella sp. M17.18]|uniref:alpha/beta hydrolase n=1 Tax=Jiella sp. M17.18 TaxID=3234247 RepID=UPI0034DF04A8
MISRRSFLLATGAAGLLALPARAAPPASAEVFPLWPGRAPGGGGPQGPLTVTPWGSVRNVATPTLEVFVPARPNGSAVLVAGGGGYKRISLDGEARPAARWLADRGITAFVLTYRLPGEGWLNGPLAPLQDAQRALRLIRSAAPRYRLDPAKIGVLGFSAGGHLMGMAATRFDLATYDPVDLADRLSARPADAALIYPVITLEPPYDGILSRRMLVGSKPSADASARWSIETDVKADCPPMFLVQAADDPIVNPQNTVIMETACRRAKVPVERRLLPSGGHGFGMGRKGSPTQDWPRWYAAWLGHVGMIAALTATDRTKP